MPPIYHFTRGENLAPIVTAGELRAHSLCRDDTVVEIADREIKQGRESRVVSCGRGGFVGDYVPFYFAPRSPMLYKISRGGVEGVDPDQRPIVYLVSSTERVVESELGHVFTDGNAATAITLFYDDLSLLGEKVDWPLMDARYWRNTDEDGDRVRRRMAEFLVHSSVPFDLIDEVGVYDGRVGERAEEILAGAGVHVPVRVRRDWYF